MYKRKQLFPNFIFKSDVVSYVKDNYVVENKYIFNVSNSFLTKTINFKNFWKNYINTGCDDELEISELQKLFELHLNKTNSNISILNEKEIIEIIENFI